MTDDIGFPLCNEIIICVHQLAATTGFEMAADGRDTLVRWGHNFYIAQLIAIDLTCYDFTWQGKGRKYWSRRDTVTLVAQTYNFIMIHDCVLQWNADQQKPHYAV